MDPLDRVWAAAAGDPRAALDRDLPPADLRTLLLGVARERAAAVTPAAVVRQWRGDRFVAPSAADPRLLAALEARLWGLVPETYAGVALSPVAPLGNCAATAGVAQNRVVTTMRGTEVVSDCTNVLAVEAAVRRRAGSPRADLATCHRVLRAQVFDAPGALAHFVLFALVSSARDTGSGRTEAALLTDHVRFWAAALGEVVPEVAVRIGFTSYGTPLLLERWRDTVVSALEPLPRNVSVVEEPEREHGRGYYEGGAISVSAGDVSLGDGGLVPWTARLLGDAKERCLVSCLATERLAGLAAT